MLRDKYQAVLSVLDQLDVGLCIALEDGTLVVRNTEADRLFANHNGILISEKNKVQCADPVCNAQLQLALIAACDEMLDEPVTNEIMVLPGSSTSSEILLEVAPLHESENSSKTLKNLAVLTLIDPTLTHPISVDRVALAYQLTDTEARICYMLIDGKTTREMAEIRGVSMETIKSQVKSIMSKTQSKRRSDLIRLVSLVTSPL